MKKEYKKSTKILISSIVLIIGLLIIGIGVCLFSNYLKKRKEYRSVTGVVVTYVVKCGARDYYEDSEEFYEDYYINQILIGDLTYAPVIEYTVNDRVYEYISHSFNSDKIYFIGQKVPLKYNQSKPEEAVLEYDFSYGIIFVVGAGFTSVGVFAMIMSFKKSKNSQTKIQ